MAIVRTTITGVPQLFPYSGTGAIMQMQGERPRGEIRFNFDAVAVALTGVGDNQQVFVSLTLPQSYAYTIADAFFALTSEAAGTNNFPNQGHASFNDRASGSPINQSVPLEFTSAGSVGVTATDNARKTYNVGKVPQGLMVPQPGQNPAMFSQYTNTTANDAAYTAKGYFRFLQFDIDQAYHVLVNSPTPVR